MYVLHHLYLCITMLQLLRIYMHIYNFLQLHTNIYDNK